MDLGKEFGKWVGFSDKWTYFLSYLQHPGKFS